MTEALTKSDASVAGLGEQLRPAVVWATGKPIERANFAVFSVGRLWVTMGGMSKTNGHRPGQWIDAKLRFWKGGLPMLAIQWRWWKATYKPDLGVGSAFRGEQRIWYCVAADLRTCEVRATHPNTGDCRCETWRLSISWNGKPSDAQIAAAVARYAAEAPRPAPAPVASASQVAAVIPQVSAPVVPPTPQPISGAPITQDMAVYVERGNGVRFFRAWRGAYYGDPTGPRGDVTVEVPPTIQARRVSDGVVETWCYRPHATALASGQLPPKTITQKQFAATAIAALSTRCDNLDWPICAWTEAEIEVSDYSISLTVSGPLTNKDDSLGPSRGKLALPVAAGDLLTVEVDDSFDDPPRETVAIVLRAEAGAVTELTMSVRWDAAASAHLCHREHQHPIHAVLPDGDIWTNISEGNEVEQAYEAAAPETDEIRSFLERMVELHNGIEQGNSVPDFPSDR